MHYGIDASSANKQTRTGVEWYAFHVIEQMKRLDLREGETVTLYSDTPLRGSLVDLPDDWEEKVLDWFLPFGWMRGRMSWEMIKQPPNVLFVPAQGLPFFTPNSSNKQQATVTTVHDVGFKRFPGLYDRSVRRRLESVTDRAVKCSTQILTVSNFSKDELVDLYKIDPEDVSVIYPAVDRQVFSPSSAEVCDAVLEQYDIADTFFLSVGRLEKKKNISTLIRAFEQFKKRRSRNDTFQLVLAGTPGFGFEEIETLYEESNVRKDIHITGYLPSDEIVALMSAASAYVFPSKYEGFGLPNLEAMACRTPLITADIPPHREIVGEAGVFVSPNDTNGWAMAMQRIAEEDSLAEDLVEKGLTQIDRFSWQETAENIMRTLRESVK